MFGKPKQETAAKPKVKLTAAEKREIKRILEKAEEFINTRLSDAK